MAHSSKTSALLQLIRFDKPIGTLLLLWPTLWALWLAAQGVPDVDLLVIFVVGTFLTRSAGCIVNDLADRNLDGAVARTSARPLVTGAVTVREALILFVALMLLAFMLVLLTNTLTIALSIVAVLLASSYPFMKRYTHLPQLVLGAAFSWGIPMAFAAQRGTLPPALWLVYLGNLLWTVAYDTAYAMVDREDDLRIGIKSTRHPVRSVRSPDHRPAATGLLAVPVPGGAGIRAGLILQRRPGGSRRAVRLSAVPDPRTPARRLLQGLPAQQLGRHGDIRRCGAQLSGRKCLSRPWSMPGKQRLSPPNFSPAWSRFQRRSGTVSPGLTIRSCATSSCTDWKKPHAPPRKPVGSPAICCCGTAVSWPR